MKNKLHEILENIFGLAVIAVVFFTFAYLADSFYRRAVEIREKQGQVEFRKTSPAFASDEVLSL